MPAKRRYGSGTIYQSAEGWRGALSVLRADGSRGRKAFRGTSRRDIEQQFAAFRREVEHQQPAGSDATLGHYLDQWLASVRDTAAPATHRGYVRRMAHVRRELGAVRLCDLTPGHVQAAISALIAGGLARSTVANVRAVLSIALNQARVWKLIASNPVRDTKPPRVPKTEPTVLTPAQVTTLLVTAADAGDPLVPLWALLFVGGLRLGEALGLRWVDLEPGACAVHVRQQVQREPGQWAYSEPKGRRPRTVIVTPLVMGLVCGLPRTTALVFPSPHGEPWHQPRIRERLRAALVRAGLPADVTPHSLRHSVATDAMRRGINPRLVQAHLGHANVALTLQKYSHVDTAMAGQLAAGLAELLPAALVLQPMTAKALPLPLPSDSNMPVSRGNGEYE